LLLLRSHIGCLAAGRHGCGAPVRHTNKGLDGIRTGAAFKPLPILEERIDCAILYDEGGAAATARSMTAIGRPAASFASIIGSVEAAILIIKEASWSLTPAF
jgi:hypothetical protein